MVAGFQSRGRVSLNRLLETSSGEEERRNGLGTNELQKEGVATRGRGDDSEADRRPKLAVAE